MRKKNECNICLHPIHKGECRKMTEHSKELQKQTYTPTLTNDDKDELIQKYLRDTTTRQEERVLVDFRLKEPNNILVEHGYIKRELQLMHQISDIQEQINKDKKKMSNIIKYGKGSYNKSNGKEQWIRLSEGCPNNCEFCYETRECGKEPIYFTIPLIIRNKVKILDMNLIYKDRAVDTIKWLGNCRVNKKVVYYELICGIDWRYMTQEKADALQKNRFINIRFAWDHTLMDQMKIKDCINMLFKAGYKPNKLSCFIICDWKISYEHCLRKLDLLKIWNVKVNDCWYDNVISPNFQLNYWTIEQCKDFRKRCRKHNQMILFGIDPELR